MSGCFYLILAVGITALACYTVFSRRATQLRNELQLLKTVLDQIQVGVIACDTKGFVMFLNSTVKSLHPSPRT